MLFRFVWDARDKAIFRVAYHYSKIMMTESMARARCRRSRAHSDQRVSAYATGVIERQHIGQPADMAAMAHDPAQQRAAPPRRARRCKHVSIQKFRYAGLDVG